MTQQARFTSATQLASIPVVFPILSLAAGAASLTTSARLLFLYNRPTFLATNVIIQLASYLCSIVYPMASSIVDLTELDEHMDVEPAVTPEPIVTPEPRSPSPPALAALPRTPAASPPPYPEPIPPTSPNTSARLDSRPPPLGLLLGENSMERWLLSDVCQIVKYLHQIDTFITLSSENLARNPNANIAPANCDHIPHVVIMVPNFLEFAHQAFTLLLDYFRRCNSTNPAVIRSRHQLVNAIKRSFERHLRDPRNV